ncbi:MAG: hypothetical protein LRY40_06350 [Shewanella fodinae]|nr:hypothetical protein [Shewanella fodinae]
MSRLFVWQHKSGFVAIIGMLLSALVFCLALLILPLLLLAAAGVLLVLSLFGRRYLKQHMARMQQYRFRASKRDIYDATPMCVAITHINGAARAGTRTSRFSR